MVMFSEQVNFVFLMNSHVNLMNDKFLHNCAYEKIHYLHIQYMQMEGGEAAFVDVVVVVVMKAESLFVDSCVGACTDTI